MEGFFLAPNTQITNLAVLSVVLVAFTALTGCHCCVVGQNFIIKCWVAVIRKVLEAAIFMAIGAALFAANPRVGQGGGWRLPF